MRVDVHTEAVDPYNAPLRTKERALYLCCARFCCPRCRRDTHSDERRIMRVFLLLDLRHLDAARLRDARRIDVVDLALEDGVEHPLEECRRKKARVDLGNLAVVDDLHMGDGPFGERANGAAELLRECDVGTNDAHDLFRNRSHVDRRRHGFAAQSRTNALCHVDGHADLCLHGGCAEVRCEHNARNAAQRMILRERLALEHVDRRPRNDPILDCRRQITFVDNAAARPVDETHALLHLTQLWHRDHAARLLRQRHMYRDKVRRRKDIVERPYSHAECLCTFLIDVRIIRNDVHIKGKCTLCNATADAPHANDAERLAAQLHTDERLAIPRARVHRRIRRWDLACKREHHRHCVLRRGNCIATRRVDDNDPALRRRLYVDVVHADTCASNDLEFIGAREHIRRHLRRRAHHESIVVTDDLHEFLMRDLVSHIDLILRQQSDPLGRNSVHSQNLHP